MKKHKMLITLAGLVAVVATSATITAYSLSGDGSGTPRQESLGAQEPAFDVGGLSILDPGPGQMSDDGSSVSVDNPETGGGAIGVHDPSGQGTWPKDNPPTDDMTDTPPTFDPAPNTIDDGQGNMPVANPEGPPPIEPTPTPTDDVDDLGEEVVRVTLGLADLQDSFLAAGADVKLTGEVVSEDPFQVDGRVLEVNGERVLVMDYGDAVALEAEAAGISPDGSSVGTHMVTWVGSPHFFRTETAIVLYVGESHTVIEALTKVIGPQFAGR